MNYLLELNEFLFEKGSKNNNKLTENSSSLSNFANKSTNVFEYVKTDFSKSRLASLTFELISKIFE